MLPAALDSTWKLFLHRTPPKTPNGAKMKPKWTPNGTKMELKWTENGANMDLRWSENRAINYDVLTS